MPDCKLLPPSPSNNLRWSVSTPSSIKPLAFVMKFGIMPGFCGSETDTLKPQSGITKIKNVTVFQTGVNKGFIHCRYVAI